MLLVLVLVFISISVGKFYMVAYISGSLTAISTSPAPMSISVFSVNGCVDVVKLQEADFTGKNDTRPLHPLGSLA